MTRPMSEAVEAARRIVAWDDAGRLADDEWLVERNESAIIAIARALLSTSAAVRGMREAAQNVIEHAQTSVTDHEGQQHAMEDDRGEALYLVQFEAIEQLRAALSGIEPGEDEQARGQGRSAPISTDTKGTTK